MTKAKTICEVEKEMIEPQELFPIETSYPPAPPLDVYIVFAYWGIGKYWKMFSFQSLTRKEAQDFVNSLSGGYGDRRIFHVKG